MESVHFHLFNTQRVGYPTEIEMVSEFVRKIQNLSAFAPIFVFLNNKKNVSFKAQIIKKYSHQF